jgi:hypothetical protein
MPRRTTVLVEHYQVTQPHNTSEGSSGGGSFLPSKEIPSPYVPRERKTFVELLSGVSSVR